MQINLEVTFQNLTLFHIENGGSVCAWLPDYRNEHHDTHRLQVIVGGIQTVFPGVAVEIRVPGLPTAGAVDLGGTNKNPTGCPGSDDSFYWVSDTKRVAPKAALVSNPKSASVGLFKLYGGELRTASFVDYKKQIYKYSCSSSSIQFESAIASTVRYRCAVDRPDGVLPIEFYELDGSPQRLLLTIPARPNAGNKVEITIDNEPLHPSPPNPNPTGKGQHFKLHQRLLRQPLPPVDVVRKDPCNGRAVMHPRTVPLDPENCYPGRI